jgi:endonuclease YncB( thermonuclease family)
MKHISYQRNSPLKKAKDSVPLLFKIVDGDTVLLKNNIEVRLVGIRAP